MTIKYISKVFFTLPIVRLYTSSRLGSENSQSLRGFFNNLIHYCLIDSKLLLTIFFSIIWAPRLMIELRIYIQINGLMITLIKRINIYVLPLYKRVIVVSSLFYMHFAYNETSCLILFSLYLPYSWLFSTFSAIYLA